MTKRINTTMIVGLMAGIVMLAGCKREYGTVTLGANIDNGRDAKVYIDDLTPCWHNNDLIRVNNQTCTTSAALGSSAQITDVVESSHYRAIYPADIVGTVNITNRSTVSVTLPRIYQFEDDSHGDQIVKVPMGAYSSNETLTFHNLCSLIKVVISNVMDEPFPLDSIQITASNAYLSGSGRAYLNGNANDAVEMLSSAKHSVSLVFSSLNRPIIGRGNRDTYVYYIIAPEFPENNVTIKLYSQGRYTTFVKQSVSLHHNKIARVNLTIDHIEGDPVLPPVENGALPGLFSVSSTRQVRFSQGNLQYRASTGTWRFAEHQWDYVGTHYPAEGYESYTGGTVSGSDNYYISSTYSGWIDLFGWGTSGWNSGAVCYQPWSTSITNSSYRPGGSYANNLTGSYIEADWAWHNAISNGGNTTHYWRTLTNAEWDYLLNTRAGAASKKSVGNINGVCGLIILPDNWTLPSGSDCEFHSVYDHFNPDYETNSYTFSQWAAMEAAGAVFLPAAGYRYNSRAYEVGDRGVYWSSTSNGERAYNLDYTDGYFDITTNISNSQRLYGHSVRPVRNYN